VDGREAVVIDGGSRPDFPTVMMKILQTGLNPSDIRSLIYQHYDPDLCGSAPHFEAIIGRKDLQIISDNANHMFIQHYPVTSPLVTLEKTDNVFRFSSGRTLTFFKTPYCHSPGSFITLDDASGILFSSDLYGSYTRDYKIFLSLEEDCFLCRDYEQCPRGRNCPLVPFLKFHRDVMPSEKSLQFALATISEIPFKMIAPQHGCIVRQPRDILLLSERLAALRGVGIDGVLEDRAGGKPVVDLSAMKERLGYHDT
ncbi:hypothetical protein ACFL43_02750, partial [Thermodesulfobacteriota bacterium]